LNETYKNVAEQATLDNLKNATNDLKDQAANLASQA
jgi:hypothetical protein